MAYVGRCDLKKAIKRICCSTHTGVVTVATPQGPENLHTMPHQAPDGAAVPLQAEKQQMQQVVTVSKETHVSHERSTTPPMMPSLQKVLEEALVALDVSEDHQTQVTTNSTLQEIQVKTQQYKEQQETILLLEEEETSPSKLLAVTTSLPTPQEAIHEFFAPGQSLQSTPTPQKPQDETNASQQKPQTMPQPMRKPEMTTSSQTSVPKHSLEDYMTLMEKLEISLVVEFLSLTPMIVPKLPSKGLPGDISCICDSVQGKTGGIQSQPVHDNMDKPNIGAIQKNQEQPSEILLNFHKNLMSALLSEEVTELYYSSGGKGTFLLPNDMQAALQDLEQFNSEIVESDSDTSSKYKIKENTYVKRLRDENNVSGMKKTDQVIPLTGSYCRIRHSLLQIRHHTSSNQETKSMPQAIMKLCFRTDKGVNVRLGPTAILLPPERFVEHISEPNHSEETTNKSDRLKMFCGHHSSSQEAVTQGQPSGATIVITEILKIVDHLSGQANSKALKAHRYVFSALLQKLHRRNRAASEYFKKIVAECSINSEVQIEVDSSQAQIGVGNELIRTQDRGLTDRFHLQLLLKVMKVAVNDRGFLSEGNDSGTSIQTVSQTDQNKKIGICCIINWNQKFNRSSTAKYQLKNRLKNLKYCCLKCKTASPVTGDCESSKKVSVPGRMPKQNEQIQMQRTMRATRQLECKELCNIFCAAEDAIIACVSSLPSSKKAQNKKMRQASKRATGRIPNLSTEVSSSEDYRIKASPGDMYLLMSADDQIRMIWDLLVESTDGTNIETQFYEAGKDGFIEYMRTSEALQHGGRSHSATEHNDNTVPTCKCDTCIDKSDGGSTKSISHAAIVIHSFNILMEALAPVTILGDSHCKEEYGTEMLQELEDIGQDDNGKDYTKKTRQEKRQSRRH